MNVTKCHTRFVQQPLPTKCTRCHLAILEMFKLQTSHPNISYRLKRKFKVHSSSGLIQHHSKQKPYSNRGEKEKQKANHEAKFMKIFNWVVKILWGVKQKI